MSETRGLLDRIAALRRDQDSPSPPPAATPGPTNPTPSASTRLAALEKQAAAGHRQDALADRAVRQVAGPAARLPESPAPPRQLTAHTRRLLGRGRSLV